MEQLLRHGGLSICGETVTIEAVAPRLTRVACRSLPGYVADENFLRAMAPYGKVVAVERLATVDRPVGRLTVAGDCGLYTVRNGHRIVQIEIKPEKPVQTLSESLNIARCKIAGHYRKDCKEDFCDRCSTFGHTTASCTAKCRRCRGDHATADCVKPRSFAEVRAGRERRQRSVVMEENGGNDGSTPPSGTVSAEEPAAPSHNEANRAESEAQASPLLYTQPPRERNSSCSSPQPLVIVEDDALRVARTFSTRVVVIHAQNPALSYRRPKDAPTMGCAAADRNGPRPGRHPPTDLQQSVRHRTANEPP
ncbi:hypothetical protein HPB48_015738 [Haemaphysalis longicornis]|uniref:Uncharacterized protein n=1 Tax=Haemaphysalis longicornis TaxID=44386 RepID=A0A9J6H6X0_HAELO|nr:hypothetical protein HPB48_015738 [Haemaphysalis longicornis]